MNRRTGGAARSFGAENGRGRSTDNGVTAVLVLIRHRLRGDDIALLNTRDAVRVAYLCFDLLIYFYKYIVSLSYIRSGVVTKVFFLFTETYLGFILGAGLIKKNKKNWLEYNRIKSLTSFDPL